MKKASASIAAIALLAALTLAPSAAAGTEFGSNCSANDVENQYVFLDLSHNAAAPLPATAPVSGVITQAKTSIDIPIPPGVQVAATLQVYRPAGPNQFTLVAESASAAVGTGANTFGVRVPVQAGDHLGFLGYGPGGVVGFLCETKDPGDVLAYTEEQPVPGGTSFFETATGYQAPIAAVIEPDADGDGYGDETQDGCPQSAAFQTACPLVDVSLSTLAGKGSVRVYVAGYPEGPVSLQGVVKLGKGRKATLKAGPNTVTPGKIVAFNLKFTAKLKKRLQELEPSQKLTLKITASATNAAGQISTDTVKAKLKGQG